ncbi:AcaB family transcriptional regulator [Aliivibrio fischeri]|uniref:AcaB family transcriptional regulator n=1 Tax=Aliivibrio fischeri TaxID=668 RepID=UPI0007C4F9C0|nr:AcaB family transcriptional regulator [Aliivibrio fischeri]
MTNIESQKGTSIAKMLSSSSDLFGLEKSKSNTSTRSKDQIGVLRANVEVNLLTIEAARIFDGKSSAKNGPSGFIPGLHPFDARVNNVIVPAHKLGCPVARTALIKIENMTNTLDENIKHSHESISAKIKEYIAQNPQVNINQPTNDTPLTRTISFSTPHTRELFGLLIKFEKVIILQKTYFYLMPKERQEIMEEQRSVTKLFRSIMHLSMQYKTNQSTAIDYSEGNSKASDMFVMNEKYFSEAKDMLQSSATSIFFPKFKTSEEIIAERDKRYDESINESNEKEKESLAERSQLIAKSEAENSEDKVDNEPQNVSEELSVQ